MPIKPATSYMSFFFLMIRRPPRSTLFPTRRSSDLLAVVLRLLLGGRAERQGGQLREAVDELRHLGAEVAADVLERSEEHRLNSSHDQISYAVFCLKKKKKYTSSRCPPMDYSARLMR